MQEYNDKPAECCQSINQFIYPEIQGTGPDTKGGYNLHLVQLPVKTMQ